MATNSSLHHSNARTSKTKPTTSHGEAVITQRKTVADQVYLDLRSRLIAGTYLPAQKLTLRALAQEFGTSMMPVRDAVKRLGAQGGLQINANRTIQVSAPSSEEFEEMLKIRMALEGLACESAVKRMRDTEIAKIRQIEQRFEREALRLRPNPEMLSKINRDFHFGIYRASKMPQLLDLIENLWVQVSPVLSLAIRYTAQGLTLRDAQRHHIRLVESITKRDTARARLALVADIKEAGDLILRSGLLRQYDRTASPEGTNASRTRQHRLR